MGADVVSRVDKLEVELRRLKYMVAGIYKVIFLDFKEK